MEGLIPLAYKVIINYKNGKDRKALISGGGCWLTDSPSASYTRLPSESSSPDHYFGFSSFPNSSSAATSSSANHEASSPFQIATALFSGVVHGSPVRRRVAA